MKITVTVDHPTKNGHELSLRKIKEAVEEITGGFVTQVSLAPEDAEGYIMGAMYREGPNFSTVPKAIRTDEEFVLPKSPGEPFFGEDFSSL